MIAGIVAAQSRLAVFTPANLFLAGEQGAWYDPSDFSSMFQDSAGTIAVTAVGQSVGKINDKSGRGNHAAQATTASKPILRQTAGGKYYLETDGVDDFMESVDTVAGIIAAATSGRFDAAAFANNEGWVTMSTDVASSFIFNGASNTGTALNSGEFGSSMTGNRLNGAASVNAPMAADGVVSAYATVARSTAKITMFRDRIHTGRMWAGRTYGVILLNRQFTTQERSDVESYLAGKAGVTL